MKITTMKVTMHMLILTLRTLIRKFGIKKNTKKVLEGRDAGVATSATSAMRNLIFVIH